jgi:hypothetical protein
MPLYIINYNLIREAEFDYSEFYDKLQSLDAVKYQDSAYFLSALSDLTTVSTTLAALIHDDDLLMVVEFTKEPDWTSALSGTRVWLSRHFP